MVKIVILGSCRFEPYVILAKPKKLTDTPHTTKKGYEMACSIFYPAIEESDLIIVYAPDGIGEHTQRDIDYAYTIGKKVSVLFPLKKKAPEKFNLRKEVNQKNFSLGQRKFLVVLIDSFRNADTSDKAICNLTCAEIEQVLELFQRHLRIKMMC